MMAAGEGQLAEVVGALLRKPGCVASALVGVFFVGYAGLAAWVFGGVVVPGSFTVIGALLVAHVVWVGVAHRRAVRGAASVHELWRLVRYCDACDGVFLPGPSAGEQGLAGRELMSIGELHSLLRTIDGLCITAS